MKKNYSITIKQLKTNKASLLFAVAFMASVNLNAQNWTGATDTNFTTATNWDTGIAPVAAGVVVVNPGAFNPVVSSTTTISSLAINPNGSLGVQANLTVSATSYLGSSLTVDSGTMNVRNSLYLGVGTAPVNPATVTVNGGTLNAKAFLIVAERGACTLNINGGTVSVDQSASTSNSIIIGGYYNSGTVNLNGGVLKTNLLRVGVPGLAITESPKSAAGVGVLNINGGTLILGGDQTAFINGYVTANKIVPGAGKQIVVTYDGTNTNVTAVASLGTDSFEKTDIVKVYPNPSTDGKFTISLPSGYEGANLSIHNTLGQVIYKATVGTGNSYDLSSNKVLTSGIYFVQLEKDGKSVTKKLVVK
ncbi:T9SS type A sorting domain-containing protein [Flavobacterium sp. WC2509]|uniref:T9SS type A sorting domain-containing protein n=1 Tax=Flavobacterium sp. WC2509 TaxID=3461406 RepID=UPI0040448742